MSEYRTLSSPDTVLYISYSSLMYETKGSEVCFMVEAEEGINPHGPPGKSRSATTCTPVTEIITVPDIFTPDNNGINDTFAPVLSFTPSGYLFIITDVQRNVVFRSKESSEKWSGSRDGDPMPEGVYIWYLKIVTPGGKKIMKTGSVTLIINQH
jgi:gliding motility-associated-like protein